MNAAWGILLAQVALFAVSLVLLVLSRRTPKVGRARLSVCRKVGSVTLVVTCLLFGAMYLLRSLVIGFLDHLLVFGIPLVTAAFCIITINRTR